MSDQCRCAEMLDKSGHRMTLAYEKWHDCGYVMRRSALVPGAALRVNTLYGCLPGPRFTRLFANEMEKQAREAKLA